MKRFCLLSFLFLLPFSAYAKNKVSMVTYFPVPYVAYSQINAEQIDAGLTSTCDMKLGCDESSIPLSVKTVNVTSGRLDLNGGLGVKGSSLELGSGSGAGHIAFQNVRIQTGAMQSVHAGSVNVEELSLFGKKFPSCKAVNAAGNGKMQWQSLKLAGAAGNELYLVCGDAEAASELEEEEEEEKCYTYEYLKNHKAECCPLYADDPEASVGTCFLRKYVWGEKEIKSALGSSASFSYYTAGSGCADGLSDPVFPGRTLSGGSSTIYFRCPDNLQVGAECESKYQDTTCYLAFNGYWWENEGVEIGGYLPVGVSDIKPYRCGCNDGMTGRTSVNCYTSCTCYPSSWPGHRCKETFVRNGW